MTYEQEEEIKAQALDQIAEQIKEGFTSGLAQPGKDGAEVSWSLEMEVVKA